LELRVICGGVGFRFSGLICVVEGVPCKSLLQGNSR
jgi:hypothetical protein